MNIGVGGAFLECFAPFGALALGVVFLAFWRLHHNDQVESIAQIDRFGAKNTCRHRKTRFLDSSHIKNE